MKIKNKIKDLENMFYECKNLKNIDELKYLNTKYCNNFEGMFCGCSSLRDIKGLEQWNVSNGKNFRGMFYGCPSLSGTLISFFMSGCFFQTFFQRLRV